MEIVGLILTLYGLVFSHLVWSSSQRKVTALIDDRFLIPDGAANVGASRTIVGSSPTRTRSLVILKNDGKRDLKRGDISQSILLRVPIKNRILRVEMLGVYTPQTAEGAFESLADLEEKGKLVSAHGATLEQITDFTVLFSFDHLDRNDACCFFVDHTAKRLSISGATGGKKVTRMWTGRPPRRVSFAALILASPALLLTCLYIAGMPAVRDSVDMGFFAYYLAYAFVSMMIVGVITWFVPGKDDVLDGSWRKRPDPSDSPKAA